MKYTKMILSSLLSVAVMTSFAGDEITLPSKDTLLQRFQSSGIQDAGLEDLAEELGGVKKAPEGVVISTEFTLSDPANVSAVVKVILQDHPAAIQRLVAEGSLD